MRLGGRGRCAQACSVFTVPGSLPARYPAPTLLAKPFAVAQDWGGHDFYNHTVSLPALANPGQGRWREGNGPSTGL